MSALKEQSMPFTPFLTNPGLCFEAVICSFSWSPLLFGSGVSWPPRMPESIASIQSRYPWFLCTTALTLSAFPPPQNSIIMPQVLGEKIPTASLISVFFIIVTIQHHLSGILSFLRSAHVRDVSLFQFLFSSVTYTTRRALFFLNYTKTNICIAKQCPGLFTVSFSSVWRWPRAVSATLSLEDGKGMPTTDSQLLPGLCLMRFKDLLMVKAGRWWNPQMSQKPLLLRPPNKRGLPDGVAGDCCPLGTKSQQTGATGHILYIASMMGLARFPAFPED